MANICPGRLVFMWKYWPTGRFALRLHRDEGIVAGVDGLDVDRGGADQRWYADRFRAHHVRIRNAATGLYLTADSDRIGAAVTGRPLFPEVGEDYWLQAWMGLHQADTGRFRIYHDLSVGVLGRKGNELVLEETVGEHDTTCTAWVVPAEPLVEPAPGTGLVMREARCYRWESRVIEGLFDEISFTPVPGRTLAPGTRLERFEFDRYSVAATYQGVGDAFVASEDSGLRKRFHRVAADPPFYVDGDDLTWLP